MRRLFFLMTAFLVAGTLLQAAPADELAHRILGRRATRFVFVTEEAPQDFFCIEQQGRKIRITGNNANSQAMGLNYYLKHIAHVHVSWLAEQPVQLPWRLPKVKAPVRREALVKDRFFLNYCTYGYTMPWWGWEQWERFIDWMALNGVTMPLAITGQEAVWYEVWKEFGMSDEEIRSYFSGPAHLPWHRMANLDGFQGPLPQGWLEGQKALQGQIVARERELGMTPVLPGFAGHVPGAIARMFPEADIQNLSSWCGFEPTFFLNSEDPLFPRIQRSFLEKQTALYGTDHIYGVDPFNEMDPPCWEPDYLANVSKHIYESLAAVDPEARWLQMSWVFYYKRKSWTPERLQAYLTAVPQDRLVLLDYFCENTEVWRRSDGFYGQPFIWCYLGNFGGNTMLLGDMNRLERLLSAALSEAGGNFTGIGSTLESFDVSPQIFEYLLERAWTQEADVKAWTTDWARTRLGKACPEVEQTWQVLVDSVYRDGAYYGQGTLIDARPGLEGHGTYYTKPDYSYSDDVLLQCCQALLRHKSRRDSYNYDLVNFYTQWLGNYYGQVRDQFTEAYKQKDPERMEMLSARMQQILTDTDDLLNTHPSFMLGKWLADARALGTTPDEKAYYEKNARTLLTIWGGPILNDYANRLWGGLVGSYYRGRWALLLDEALASIREDRAFDSEGFEARLKAFEEGWNSLSDTYPSRPQGKTRRVARRVQQHIDEWISNK
ncbi:MAG: alpha-N-acetylglucosaminidase [Bacteroidales bacterium]|nr:alpha-N-acetylglucosaminidase [Bacteroidales bacterium]